MPLDIRIRLGRAIRRIREDQKFNQEEAAERCGLHPTVLQRNQARRQERIAVNSQRNKKMPTELPSRNHYASAVAESACCAGLGSESASTIPPMTPKRTTSVKSR